MGTQKLLLPFHGQPLIVRVVDQLLRSPAEQVFVVIGRDARSIVEALGDRNVQFVTNARDEDEMLYSVRCGLTAMPKETTGAIVALGDQPGITADVVERLAQTFRTTNRGIVVPTYEGKRGHPLLIAMRYRDEILTDYEGRGLRGLLEAHPEDIFDLEVAANWVVEDMDLPEDYHRAIDP
jgi:molybdenum cofactor cytidylyltransferase